MAFQPNAFQNDAFQADAGGGAVTGTLAATEGADVATFAGSESFTGTLAATEGADGASFTGISAVGVAGALAATEGADACVMSGTVGQVVTGTLAVTEGADNAAFAGVAANPVTGTLAATEGADGASFTGTGGIVIPSDKGAGGVGGKGRRRRAFVRIDDRYVEVRNEREAIAILKAAQKTVREVAKQRIEEVAKPAAKTKAVPLLTLPEVEIGGSEAWIEPLQAQMDDYRREVQEAYAQALVGEMRKLEAKAVFLQDEVEALTALVESD